MKKKPTSFAKILNQLLDIVTAGYKKINVGFATVPRRNIKERTLGCAGKLFTKQINFLAATGFFKEKTEYV